MGAAIGRDVEGRRADGLDVVRLVRDVKPREHLVERDQILAADRTVQRSIGKLPAHAEVIAAAAFLGEDFVVVGLSAVQVDQAGDLGGLAGPGANSNGTDVFRRLDEPGRRRPGADPEFGIIIGVDEEPVVAGLRGLDEAPRPGAVVVQPRDIVAEGGAEVGQLLREAAKGVVILVVMRRVEEERELRECFQGGNGRPWS